MSFVLPFRLTKKNQKGQVAIFVALIFQIIFIFFAILINVGLLVHHKINLQQSTDLAAYYGAMKQAEILNVIGHVNFQIRQAWKLLTWRYRVLGTFGHARVSNADAIGLPILLTQNGLPPAIMTGVYNEPAQRVSCPNIVGDGTTIPLTYPVTVFPVFCSSHSGLGGWTNTDMETFCKMDCDTIRRGVGQQINKIPQVGSFAVTSGGANATSAGAIQRLVSGANANIRQKCSNTGAFAAAILSQFLNSYSQDLVARREVIKTLAVNLTDTIENTKDIEGNSIKKGAENTFNNNLTEANLSSADKKVDFYNGLDEANCKSSDTYDAATSTNFKNGFLNEIAFKFLQFYLVTCRYNNTGNDNDYTGSTFNIGTLLKSDFSEFDMSLLSSPQTIVEASKIQDVKNSIEQAFRNKFSVGFEKNPWCVSYFAVRAKSAPKIPFLPLAKVTLSATSIAKPFGGTIGPWYGQSWPSVSPTSSDNGPRIDENLPKRDINGAITTLGDSLGILMNYSNYVGDNAVTNNGGGLADARYIANYHEILLKKELPPPNTVSSSNNPKNENSPKGVNSLLIRPTQWPHLSNWGHASESILNNSNTYDSLALDYNNGAAAQNSHLRDLEISVVAPNQFDLSYYSIDADFYNNYYKKLKIGMTKMNSNFKINYLRPDFGYNQEMASAGSIPADYGVKDQTNVAANIIKKHQPQITDVPRGIFKFIPDSLASLLTGWTFVNLTNAQGYEKFPDETSGTNMPFGKCKKGPEEAINNSYESIAKDNQRPPTPGNCVTGGRTGYSVKIVSPAAINGPQGEIGGQGTGGQRILNPIPDRFLNFQ